MTEIPEHLLRRAAEARARAGQTHEPVLPEHLLHPDPRIPEHLLQRARDRHAFLESQAEATAPPVPAPEEEPEPAGSDPFAAYREQSQSNPKPDGYSSVKLGRHGFWLSRIVALFASIPFALAATLLVWFFCELILRLFTVPLLGTFRWSYIILWTSTTVLELIGRFGYWSHARKVGVPYKAVLVAILHYKLGSDVRAWDRTKLLGEIQVAARIIPPFGRPLLKPKR
jgi:hypothetical protein